MTAEEFTSASIALLRSAVGWQSAIAGRLNIESRHVRRWLKDGFTPSWVDEKLADMMGARDISPWPRDEWVVGDGVTRDGRRREHIVHLMPPRFVARIVSCDEDGTPEPGEQPADVTSGTVYVADPFTVLCEIEWFDEVSPGEVTHLLEAAADAIEAINEADSLR
ncbi:MAG: hypothetical protein M0006_15740 [Magnetospirillum sp.]|nr:hypothetical protein [Magnetospirillum sp.]